MTVQTVKTIFQLPDEIPSCIVQINDFDDPNVLRENVRDYVMSDKVADEMARLVNRIVASCKRQEAGRGHFLHGSFGSGKSHFMAILGLILENNAAVWDKEHATIDQIEQAHRAWLADHPILVVPVYMLGQQSFQSAVYNAANQRLARLGKALCDFSDADKVIATFRADAERYGETVYEQFANKTGFTRSRFDRMAAGEQQERDELARQILEYRTSSRAELTQLYPDKFSDGMAKLTRHAQAQGFAGVVLMVDELILYLAGKQGRVYADEINNLVALVDNSTLDRAVPLWTIVARQRFIDETIPDDHSQKHIREALDHHRDRFPETTTLADTELVPIVQERVLRVQPNRQGDLQQALEQTLRQLPSEARDTLLADTFSLDDFRRLYPFHPALIRTLIDVSARLSRERAAIRLLYELLINRHPDLGLGELVPYASLFDVVFLPEGVMSERQNDELVAVHETYYNRLKPLIDETYADTESQRQKAHTLVKTILLAGLTKNMKGPVSVERLLHLNYQNLSGRTSFGSINVISGILSELANRSELVHFNRNPSNPAQSSADIALASGVQLEDVLKRININWRQRLDAYIALMADVLSKPITNGQIPQFAWTWRGTTRRGAVRFANIAELTISSDMIVADGDEFTLFIDPPFESSESYSRADDLRLIERARGNLGSRPIGFWLPVEFSQDDRRDLDEYAKMRELDQNQNNYLQEYGKSQRNDILVKLAGQMRTKAQTLRDRLQEVYYRSPQAQATFLDTSITPSLDAQSMAGALDRIADSVCDRRYPFHPRFTSPINQRNLQILLNDFLVPAALSDSAVRRSADLDSHMDRLGLPLELAEKGANNWTLRPQSRYLSKIEELAQGRRVEVNRIAQTLAADFGFTRDLIDLFILYLIKGKGYRALRNDQPVADVDFGRLNGLFLEQGQRLAVHEWSQIKEFVRSTWLLQPTIGDLTVAAQDALWTQLNTRARATSGELQKLIQLLVEKLKLADVEPSTSQRYVALQSAQQLNELAMRTDLDAYKGLLEVLNWRPSNDKVSKEEAARQVAGRETIRPTLTELESDTISRIRTLAQNGNGDAVAALDTLRNFLRVGDAQAELTSYVMSWRETANRVIDRALSQPTPPPTTASATSSAPAAASNTNESNTYASTTPSSISGGEPTAAAGTQPGMAEGNRAASTVQEQNTQIQRAVLNVDGVEIVLTPYLLEQALNNGLVQLSTQADGQSVSGTLRIDFVQKS